MTEEEALRVRDLPGDEDLEEYGESEGRCSGGCASTPIQWFKMLASETHWSFVFGVVVVYGLSQGLGGAIYQVGTEYYMKDVQQVQPSEAQVYAGITSIPWIVKPLWGLLTDVLPILGYRRRPYFIFAGSIGMISMLFISAYKKLHLVSALLALTASSASIAIADVTIDACVAQNSNIHPSLAADMQSLCAFSVAVGALVGYFVSGVFVHLLGPKGVFSLLTIPAGLVLLVGVLLEESHIPNFAYRQVNQKFCDAGKAMWTTLKCPEIWRPCLYMYISFALSLDIREGLFYWFTDSKEGPSFSQETVGYIFSIGSVGSLMGAILYQYALKNHPFRDLLFWIQLIFGLTGLLDMVLVLRLNLDFGIPDFFFLVIDESMSKMIGRLKWMPLLVLSSKICPPGIEGTFFALMMSIDNLGLLSSSWLGGFLLHILKVTRTQFDNLWLAILIRTILRLVPLGFLFLVPRSDPESVLIPTEALSTGEGKETSGPVKIELVALVSSVDHREHVEKPLESSSL